MAEEKLPSIEMGLPLSKEEVERERETPTFLEKNASMKKMKILTNGAAENGNLKREIKMENPSVSGWRKLGFG